jgi:uncharacterized membrane protein
MNAIPEVEVGDLPANVSTPADRRAYRMASLDILRGLVIVLMALDHARDYLMTGSTQEPTFDPTTGPLLFATRWITHLCAPTFVFLSGVSAGLMARRKDPAELARFLLLRGLWLIAVEVLIVSTASSFSPAGIADLGGRTYVGLQVIWAIGASMVVLAGVQHLGPRACLAIGSAIVLGHNLLDSVWPAGMTGGSAAPLWTVLHARQIYDVGGFSIFFSYPLLPWIGVMLVGYASVRVFDGAPSARDARLKRIGLALLLGFIVLRAIDLYGDRHHWHFYPDRSAASVMSFLATTKYPPSLLYLLMTLGSAAIICAYADRLRSGTSEVLVTFGRAPLAFYLAHLYLLHTLAILLGVGQGFAVSQFLTHYRYFPKGYGVGLGGVYLTWIAVVASLYPLCRWVSALKSRRTDWWLSYV